MEISSELAPARAGVSLRHPALEDAARIWRLARETGSLDANSPYAYLLLCSDFAATGMLAEACGRVAGFALGYRPPASPDTLFVWQIAVAPAQRGRGTGSRLLAALLESTRQLGVRFVEATVTPSNRASAALFRGFARRCGAPVEDLPGFPSALFPCGGHEDELRLRIGPVAPST